MSDAILQPGRNCWRREHADRLAFLVDGASYFAAFKRALLAAREQVLIIGWDIDSRIRLERRNPMPDVPDELLALIRYVAKARPELRIHVLIWDFTLLYASDREPLPSFKLNWQTPSNVVAQYDDVLPIGGAQHQKVVVVDDRLAFVGGLDLTEGRWDTVEHAEDDPDRVDGNGEPYGPYHDVMAIFDGAAAAAVGELARERWRIVTGEELDPPPDESNDDPWPDTVEPEMRNLSIAIARNRPPIDEIEGQHEIEPLFLDSIAAARDLIFIENQYFTARTVTEALCGRLREPEGPEVVIVLPAGYLGWLEDQIMGAGLAHAVQQMKEADGHDRLRVLSPRLGHKNAMHYIVHAKVMIIDDRLVHVGSANLNNRSMSIDGECDIAVDAEGDESLARAIAALRCRLISEHCGMPPDAVACRTEERGSLIAALESFGTEGRCLKPLSPRVPDEPPEALNSFADPENPADFSEFTKRLTRIELGNPGLRETFRRAGPLLGAVVLVAAVAAGWRYTPMADWVEPGLVAEWLRSVRGSVFAPALAIGIYVLAGFVAFPVTVLIAATAIAFGPWLGLAYAFAGAMVSAVIMFAIGALVGRRTLRKLAGRHLRTLDRYLSRSGTLTVMTVRMIPIAPFTLVNLAAGAARVRITDFLAGSILGLAPGIAIMTAMGDQLVALLRNPSAWNSAILAVLLVLWIMVGVAIQRLLRRRLRNRTAKTDGDGAPAS